MCFQNPKICDIVSQEFYENRLQTDLNVRTWKENVPLSIWVNCKIPHVFCHVEGQEHYLSVNVEEGNERSCGNREESEKVVSCGFDWINFDNNIFFSSRCCTHVVYTLKHYI